MNSFSVFLTSALVYKLGWALLHSLWQGAIAAALFGMLSRIMRRRSANARYLSGCVILLMLMLVVIGTFVTQKPPAVARGEGRMIYGQSIHAGSGYVP